MPFQPTVHSDLQLVVVLSAHPISQFLHRFRWPSAIFFKNIEQCPRSCHPSNGTAAGMVSCIVQHRIPHERDHHVPSARSFVRVTLKFTAPTELPVNTGR